MMGQVRGLEKFVIGGAQVSTPPNMIYPPLLSPTELPTDP